LEPLRAPPALSLPLPLRWVRAHGLAGLTPWHFIDEEQEREGLRRQYRLEVSTGSQPWADVLPFARRQDRDDIAAFHVKDGIPQDLVLEIHLTWSAGPERPGYPGVQRYDDFWAWLQSAVADSGQWCNEDDLRHLVGEGGGAPYR